MKTRLFTKQTTHLLAYTLLCALAITTVGCSKEEPNVPEGAVKHLIATVSMSADDPLTRIVNSNNNPQWEQSDVFGVWKQGTRTVSRFERTDNTGNSALAQFEGDLAYQEGDVLFACYPFQELDQDLAVTLNVESQVLGDNSKYYVGAEAKPNSDGTIYFGFKPLVAILQIRFTGSGTPGSIRLSSSDLPNEIRIKLEEYGYQVFGRKRGDIVVTGDFSSKTASIFLFACNLSDLTMKIFDVNDPNNVVEVAFPARSVSEGRIYTYDVEYNPVAVP